MNATVDDIWWQVMMHKLRFYPFLKCRAVCKRWWKLSEKASQQWIRWLKRQMPKVPIRSTIPLHVQVFREGLRRHYNNILSNRHQAQQTLEWRKTEVFLAESQLTFAQMYFDELDKKERAYRADMQVMTSTVNKRKRVRLDISKLTTTQNE